MSDSGPGNREVAYRVFATEFEDATVSFKESDEERAPNYVISPTGGRLNRVFSVGVFTEKAGVGGGQVRARINDITGTLVTYAGQYQPGPLAFLENADPPAFLALTGKARTFEPEDGDRVYSSVRPESVNEVDAATRDRWVVRTAEQTVARVGSMAAARHSNLRGDELRAALVDAGLTESLAAGTAIAVEEYAPTSEYLQSLRTRAIQAAAVVAGDRDEVERLGLRPTEGEDDPAVLAELATVELPEGEAVPAQTTDSEPETDPDVDAEEPVETEPIAADPTGGSSAETTPVAETEAGAEPEPEPEVETEGEAEPEVEAEPATETEAATEADPEPEPAMDEDEDIEDFEPGEFDLDEEEREEVEEQFGTDFETASEFDPDEKSVEPEVEAEPEAESEPEPEPEPEGETETEPEPEGETETEPEPAGDVDPGDIVVEVIEELDGGDGADRDAVVAELVERTGADAEAADEAISGALMNGECYEPDDDLLKAI